jgi:Tol biopolymer transport system component
MPDVQEVFRMATQKVLPDPGALERQNRNQRRRSTQRKAGAFALVAVILVIGIVTAIVALRANGKGTPASHPSPTPGIAAAPRDQTPVVVGLDGVVQHEIPGLPRDAFGLSLSADCTEIAFITAKDGVNRIGTIGSDGQGLTVIVTTGIHVATNRDGGVAVAWSPDGSQIAFVGVNDNYGTGAASGFGNSDIYAMNRDGSNVRRLTTDPKVDEWPQWSPDGSRILYDNAGAEPLDFGFSPTTELWTVPAAGGAPSRLTRNSVSDEMATFSPDGTQIALFRDRGIWVMQADGSDARQIDGADGFTPRWSPDGTKIAFLQYDASWRPTADLGVERGNWPALTVSYVDVATGSLHHVPGRQVAADNAAQWLPSGYALLLNVVEKP